MQAERKQIIRYALDFEIEDINTYSGYRGDLVVKITTKDMKAVVAIRRFAMDLSIKEIVVKENLHLLQFEIFCITLDKDVYHLKTEEIMDEIHSDHPTDKWDRSKLK